MSRSPSPEQPRQSEIERKLLAALCLPELGSERRAVIIARLKSYVFVKPDHQVIYRALAGMQPLDPTSLRQVLMQAVTRFGFPDLEFDWLFTETPPIEEIAGLLEDL